MFMDLIAKRRSIRRFTADKVEAEKVELLKEAALLAPSSRGINPWEFIVVTDRSLLANLSAAKPHGSTFLKDAPLGIVVCADPQKSELGSCWIQIRERIHDETLTAEAYVADLLKIPSHLKVESMVAIGYPAERKPPHSKQELQTEKIFLDQHGQQD